MRKGLMVVLSWMVLFALGGCVMSPVTGLVCPPGMHPGPYGQRCFYN
jgi:hypothetical protein